MAQSNPYLHGMYEGVLAEPIVRQPTPGLLGPVGPESEPTVDELRSAKVPALFDHFGIDAQAADAWERLALALAQQHVPGFRTEVLGGPWFGPIFKLEFVGFENPYLPSLKRGRGRPRKPYAGPTGLLGTPIKSRGTPGRPADTPEEKRALVEMFETWKRHLGETDRGTALDIVTLQYPQMNAHSRRPEAEKLRRRVVRLRHEVRRFENS